MQNCLIWGVGISGISAAKLLINKGKNVYIYDKNTTKLLEFFDSKIIDSRAQIVKKIDKNIWSKIDTLVLSPGVKLSPKIFSKCQKFVVDIISEIDLASMYCTAPILAITGTNGKTTTVTFVHQILRAAGRDSRLVGNVGRAFCDEVETLTEDSVVVLELSSFQLEHCSHLKCRAVGLINLAPDHLNRYSSFEEYTAAKTNIFDCTAPDSSIIINKDDPLVCAQCVDKNVKNVVYFSQKPLKIGEIGYFLSENAVFCATHHRIKKLFDLPSLGFLGQHNLSNLLCAVAFAHLIGVTAPQLAAAILTLKLPRHRLEYVGEKNGVTFYNDSKATNIHACQGAISAFSQGIHLLLGGSDKGENFAEFLSNLPQNVVSVVTFGAMGKKICRQSKSSARPCYNFSNLLSAFDFVKKHAKNDEIVLLSPACASFDEFDNFEARGEYFCNLVAEWVSEE